jgi:hypothetical protein
VSLGGAATSPRCTPSLGLLHVKGREEAVEAYRLVALVDGDGR